MTNKVKSMTLKAWLKMIVRSPLMMLMGVGGDAGGEGEGDQGSLNADTLREIAGDAGPSLSERIMAFAGDPNSQHMQVQGAAASEAEAEGADLQGEQGKGEGLDEGLDTPAGEADSGADLDEDEELEGEEKDKGVKQRKFDERVAEVAEKIVAAKLAEREKAAAEDKPDFQVIDPEKVDAHIADIEAQIDELRMEGKYTEARKLSRTLDQLDKDLEENEARRVAWEAKQAGKKAATDQDAGNVEVARQKLDETAELYRDELKVDKDTWNKMGEWFQSQMSTRPLLVKEFNDVYNKSGEVAAIRFAHQHAVKHMGQSAKLANEKREQLKTKSASLTATNTGKIGPIDLKKAKAEFDANPTAEAFQKFQGIKRQAAAATGA